jgi:hypothetical protein
MPDPAAASNITIVNGQIWELVVRFAFNFVIAFLLIRLIYYRSQKNPTYAFTYFMFNVLIFFVCYLLSNVSLSIGFAFGLFAVFAILRYRTDPIPIKEMTYLFMVITIGVMNALSTPDISLLELLFANGAIVLVAFGMESYWRKTTLNEVLVIYENIENIKPENQNTLLSDLRKRTGLDIVKYKMVRTDFLRDIARIRVYYRRSNDQE